MLRDYLSLQGSFVICEKNRECEGICESFMLLCLVQFEVYDTPHIPVLVGKRVRKRLDAKSIVQLIQSLDVPSGSRVYIEQSNPFPKDGKQGWYSGGFGYGLWIGTLVASGFCVIPVSASLWKRHFQLASGSCTKDDSRRVAAELFPSLSSQLKRKKDHGRAEALLIAAYGEALKTEKLLIQPKELLSQVNYLENQLVEVK
ncbi:hypothetical protein AtNW77_Chr2g0246201 [Arabidopsis thaliana]